MQRLQIVTPCASALISLHKVISAKPQEISSGYRQTRFDIPAKHTPLPCHPHISVSYLRLSASLKQVSNAICGVQQNAPWDKMFGRGFSKKVINPFFELTHEQQDLGNR